MLLVDSLRKRYFFKVFASTILVGVAVISQSIIPRGLGALAYGNFNFLTDFFAQVLGFLSMGSSIAFYTKLSKRHNDTKMVIFYLSFIVLATAFVLLGVGLVGGLGWSRYLWPGQRLGFVTMAVVFAGMTWLVSSMSDMIDAYGLSVQGEIAKIIQRILGLGLILALFWLGAIYMRNIFIYQYVLMLVMILFIFHVIRKNGFNIKFSRISQKDVQSYGHEFYTYSQPLFLYSLVSLLICIFDRWFLQWCNGGVEQGFYSLAFKIGAVCFILSSSMTQLITREFSIAYHQQDMLRMTQIFRRHIPLLYALTAVLCCFVVANADKVTLIMGGRGFKGAILPVAIMAFYPIHQTYGQLSNAVFFATDQTRLYRNVGIVAMLIGIPVTYFLLASQAHYGLGMGSVGLALKMVVAQVLWNNVLLYFNSKFLNFSFGWYVKHQLVSVLVFIIVAFFTTWVVDHCFYGKDVLFRFFFAGFGYLLLTVAVVYLFPALLGLEHDDVSAVLCKLKKTFIITKQETM